MSRSLSSYMILKANITPISEIRSDIIFKVSETVWLEKS